jgi:uncharacterized protein (TIGR03437 family)
MRSIKITLFPLLALAAFPAVSSAQAYDSSGDKLLNGTYYLRQVFYFATEEGIDYANIQGNITFNGSGSYTFSGSLVDLENGSLPNFTAAGTYAISASGEGYITAVNQQEVDPSDQIVGLVSHGIFIGSTTENTEDYNDLFIAAPLASPEATNATLKGTYTVAYIDPSYYPSTGVNALAGGDAFFTMTANGQGNIGTIDVTGYVSDLDSSSGESLTGVTYAFSNGAAQLNLGGSSNALVSGGKLLYISPDGNFIFGGDFNGFDMFVGVRGATSNPTNYNGLYYQAGIDLDQNAVAAGDYGLDTYYGAINAFTGSNIIGHQRLNSLGAFDETYWDSYTLQGNGGSTDSDFFQQYWSTPDGSIRIGYGYGPSQQYDVLSLNVALQAPTFSGSGVYLNPTGMLNAASTSPFTAELSPGEYLSLYGTNLAPSAASATSFPLPDNLNGVQVSISGHPAPIDYVSPTQINVVVPYATETVAQIQVDNNGSTSNVVTQFVGSDSAGVFTYEPVGGIGYAAALHQDYSLITEASPAQIGETISVYLAGLGSVSGFPVDGAAAPSSSPESTLNTPVVYIDDTADNSTQATVVFSGLAPGFAGLYQINFTIPGGVAAGDTSLDISGANSETAEAILPVGSSGDATPAARAKPGKRLLLHHRRLARSTPVTRNQP